MEYVAVKRILTNVDFNKIGTFGLNRKSIKDGNDFSNSAGLGYISSIIDKILGEFTETYFFEYSVLSATYGTFNSKLFSLACVKDTTREKEFLSKVELYVKNIVGHVFDTDSYNWYHNPEFFISPSDINIINSFSDNLTHKVNDSVIKEISETSTIQNIYLPTSFPALYVSNMTYNRKIEDIYTSANSICAKYRSIEDLKMHYKLGVDKLHSYYNEFINKGTTLGHYCLLSIPLIPSSSSNIIPRVKREDVSNPLFGTGGLLLYIKLKNDNIADFKENVEKLSQELFVYINYAVHIFTSNYTFNNALNLYEESISLAKQTAISTVMSRNMSHNLGSHSLVKLGNSETMTDIFEGNYERLTNQCNTEDLQKWLKVNIDRETGERNLSDKDVKELRKSITQKWLQTYNDNTRTRMDLIADISTNIPTSENSRQLKEVLAKYTDNVLLSNTISGADNFNYVIKLEADSDKVVAIPNDRLGMDAFCIIIENFVRNIAKHGRNKRTVNIKIKAEDGADFGFDEYYRIFIYEECTRVENGICGKYNKDAIIELNHYISKSILDEDNKLRQGGWGVLEMKIAATYLRKIPVAKIDDEEYKISFQENGGEPNLITTNTEELNAKRDKIKDNWENYTINEYNKVHFYDTSENSVKKVPTLIKCHCYKAKNKDGELTNEKGLGYSFYLRKPKEILIIDCNKKLHESPDNNILSEIGINRITEFNELVNKIDIGKTFNHKILLIVGNDTDNPEITRIIKSEDYNSSLPCRIVWENENSVIFNFNTLLKQYGVERNIKRRKEISFKIFEQTWRIWRQEFNRLTIEKGITSLNKDDGQKYMVVEKTEEDRNPQRWSYLKHGDGFDKTGDDYLYIDPGNSFTYNNLPFSDLGEEGRYFSDVYYALKNTHNESIISFHESITTRIGIIDERIQSFTKGYYSTKDGKKIHYIDLFKKMNIYIPPFLDNEFYNAIDLNNANFHQEMREEFFKWVNINLDEGLDYLIIHLGIIEKLIEAINEDAKERFSKDKMGVQNFITQKITHSNNKTKIIIISGRGRPHNLPDNVRFLNFSQVQYYLSPYQSKYKLTDLCCNARCLK